MLLYPRDLYKCFNLKRFIKFIYMGFLEGLILFILGHHSFCNGNSNGSVDDFYSIGTLIYTAVVIIANLKLVLDTSFFDYPSIIIIFISVILYFVTVYGMSDARWLSEDTVISFLTLDNFENVILDLKFFFYILVTSVFCYFIEIFGEKAPILFGIITEWKLLKPYTIAKKNKSKIEIIDYIQQISLIDDKEEEEDLIK